MDALDICLKLVKTGSSTNPDIVETTAATGDYTFIVVAIIACLAIAAGVFLFVKGKLKKTQSIFMVMVLAVGLMCATAIKPAHAQDNKVNSNLFRVQTSDIVGQVDDQGKITFSDTDIENMQNWGVNFNEVKIEEVNSTNNANWNISMVSTGAKLYSGTAGQTQTSSAAIESKTTDKLHFETDMNAQTALSLVGKDVLKLHFNCKELPATKFISHAGVHLQQTIAGQNSIESMKLAKRAGFDFMEVDVRKTKDDVVVAMHNEEINNTMRQKYNYDASFPDASVQTLTLKELKDNYVFKTDNPAYRVAAPTLKEFCEAARDINMTLMVHTKPIGDGKADLHKLVDDTVKICNETVGYGRYYIVSEAEAVDYVLKDVDPKMNTMRVVKTEAEAKQYADAYTNCILAVSYKHENYDAFTQYCRNLNKHVESTLNTDVRAKFIADVINFDYNSPCRTNMYQLVASDSGKMSYDYGKTDIDFGTAELTFTLKGSAQIVMCDDNQKSHVYNLNATDTTEYRIPHFIYGSKYPAKYVITPGEDATISDIKFNIWKH